MWPPPPTLAARRNDRVRRSTSAGTLVVVVALLVTSCASPLPTAPRSTPAVTAPTATGPAPTALPPSSSAPPSAPSTPGRPTATVSRSLAATTLASTGVIVDDLVRRSGPRDPRYYRDGVFYDGSPDCFRCTLGPAVLLAVYGEQAGDKESVGLAVAAFDRAIAEHQDEDGSLGPPATGEDGPAIQTILFGNALAHAYLTLGDQLDGTHRRAWARSLTRSADYLIDHGIADYYINGNLNLSLSVNLDLTYRITGLERFGTAAEQALAFTLRPPQDRWTGFGLVYSRRPSARSGADGAGYLAETGGGKPGFDAAYSLYQLEIASLWYYLTGNPTAKRLTNLVLNQLWPRVRRSDWTLDVSGGTRRGSPGTRYGFSVSALPVLALRGGRSDLRRYVPAAAASAAREFTSATTYTHPGQSDSYGSRWAVSLAVIGDAAR